MDILLVLLITFANIELLCQHVLTHNYISSLKLIQARFYGSLECIQLRHVPILLLLLHLCSLPHLYRVSSTGTGVLSWFFL